MNHKYLYKCVNCDYTFYSEELVYLCPHCEKKNKKNHAMQGALRVLYNYDELKNKQNYGINAAIADKFLALLPLKSNNYYPTLAVGNTPLYQYNDAKRHTLMLKDDSQNPSYSYKDRASYLVSAVAKERGITKIVTASTGNAASSLASMCAANAQKAILIVPATAPKAKLVQMAMYGGKIIPIDGSYDDAFDLSLAASECYGWYNRNTAYNPFTTEGKKTAAYEIFIQTKGQLPDTIYVPTGDGVIICGIYKGFEDLLKLGIINTVPKIIAVQAEKSANLVTNLSKEVHVWKKDASIADSINVIIPRNFWMTKYYIDKYSGGTKIVSDAQIIAASLHLSATKGLFCEPAAAAAYAAYLDDTASLKSQENVLVLLTGSGLKDINAVFNEVEIPTGIEPNFAALREYYERNETI